MRLATISAAVALFTLTNAIPMSFPPELEPREKDKDCHEFKKKLKKLEPEVSEYCSSFIATTTTIVVPTTITELLTSISTITVTATTTETITGPAPTVSETVFSNCGTAGFDNGATPAYFFDGSGALGTFETCQAECLLDAGTCLSFAFGAGQCLLYTAYVEMIVVPVATSPYTFNAVNCPAPAPSILPKRQANLPEPLAEYQPAERSEFCSCVISVPSTSIVVISSTSTIGLATTTTTTATVATNVVTSTVTPETVTVTVTTTA